MRRPVLPCVLAVGLTAAVLAAVPGAASASGGDDQPTDQPAVRVSGTLLQAPVERGSGRIEPAYGLRLAGGDIVPLDADFARAPAPNARFRGTLEVPQRVQSALARTGTDLADGSTVPATSRAGQRALALVDRAGATMAVEQSSLTAPKAATGSASGTTHRLFVAALSNLGPLASRDDALLAASRTVATYWHEQSNGAVAAISTPTVIRRYATAVRGATTDCGLGNDDAVFWNLLDEAVTQLQPYGFDPASPTDQIAIEVPKRCSRSGALGNGTIGGGFATGGFAVVTSDPAYATGALAHEMGHNYGFLHANVRCGSSCSKEYDGIYDVMGYGLGAGYNQLTALGTVYRLLNGVTAAGEVADVRPGSARTLTINARSSTSGRRSLAVRDPKDGSTYVVDLRTGQGRDARAAYAAGGSLDGYQFRTGVVVSQGYGQYDDDGPIGTGGSEVVPNGGRTSFRTGEVWRSPAGDLFVRVDAQSSRSATVTVLRTVPQTAAPRLTGTVKVGRRLRLARGRWTPGTSLAQTWYVGGRAVSHATSLKLRRSARGKRVVVKVTGRKAGYVAVTRSSGATARVRR